MSRSIAIACALALSGCSLVWGVPPDRFRDAGLDAQLEDAGPDAGLDADLDAQVDGGRDAGPEAGPCPFAPRFERACGDGVDEDCDGLIDCNDFDCSADLECCEEQGPLFPIESFEPFPSDWTWMPIADGAIDQGSATTLHDFGNFGYPRAVRAPECLPIDLGVSIRATLRATNGPVVCPDGVEDCDNYVALVITESTDLIPPASLSANLAVRLDRTGRAQITAASGDVLLDSADDGVSFGAASVTVEIELSPGVDDEGQASIFATVSLTQGSTEWPDPDDEDPERRFVRRPAFPRRYLLGSTFGCTDARGLLLAFEGYGPNNSVDNVGVTRFGCANPSHFERVPASLTELTADDVDGTLTDSDDWTAGGFGSPSIQSFFPSGSEDERTELLYDASNRERTLESRDVVHYAIGGSWTTDASGIDGYVPRAAAAPLIGLRPPDCLGVVGPPGVPCDMLPSSREPALFVPVDDETRVRLAGSTTFPLVFARQSTTGAFEVAAAVAFFAEMAPSVIAAPIGAPAASGCVSMRDPVIVPTRPDSATDLVVLYTCERADAPSSIRALALDEFPPSLPVTYLPGEVIDPAALGSLATGGVRAADAAVWFHTSPVTSMEEVVVRVWFVSEDLSRDPATISFAEGTGPAGTLPQLHPYAANPVLRSSDPLLGACPAAGCQIESVAVTRLANSPNTVRLMISRTPEPTTGIRHVLVPLDQVWPAID